MKAGHRSLILLANMGLPVPPFIIVMTTESMLNLEDVKKESVT